MGKPSGFEEKRKQPRVSVRLSVNLKIPGEASHSPGVTSDASEAGLLINTLRNLPLGGKLVIEVLSAGKGKSSNFRALTQIVWKDIGLWDDWEGYVYGLKFIQIPKEDYLKLKKILVDQSNVEESRFVNKGHEEERLVIRAKLY